MASSSQIIAVAPPVLRPSPKATACAASSAEPDDAGHAGRGAGAGVVAVRDCWRCHASTAEGDTCPHCGACAPWASPGAETAPGLLVSSATAADTDSERREAVAWFSGLKKRRAATVWRLNAMVHGADADELTAWRLHKAGRL